MIAPPCPRGLSDASTIVSDPASGNASLTAALKHLREGDPAIEAFQKQNIRWFADSTRADVFEVRNGQSTIERNLDDKALRASIDKDTTSSSPRVRIVFLDGDENDAERLPVTRDTLQHVFETYRISPRFGFYLSRQQHAGSSTHFDSSNDHPERLEFWYAAVIRTLAEHTPDNSRRVMNWLRCCIWGDFDAVTGNTTILSTRYPVWMKEAFYNEFAGSKGALLEQHPMLVHALWMERLGTATRDINCWFYEPIYELENQLVGLKTPKDLFAGSRSIRQIYRQIRQILTDYEVFLASAKCMRQQNKAMEELVRLHAERKGATKPSLELQTQLDTCFQQVRKELKLGKVYLTLYLERCNAGIADSQSVSSQHSAEIQIQSSKEFTSLSRDSHEDNQSLRNIQILTALFLPPSLISSIFGMGFFSTAREGDGGAQSPVVFSVAENWWLYLAITLPVTALIVLMVLYSRVGWHAEHKRLYWRRRSSANNDLELGAFEIK